MLRRLLLATALVMLAATAAHAREATISLNHGFECKEPMRWADRLETRGARIVMDNSDEEVTLLVTDRVMALQLSDRTMHKVDRELHQKEHAHDADDDAVGDALRSAVIGAVRSLLDHSIVCPLDEIRDVRYEDGRLVIVGRDGHELFERVDHDDADVLTTFVPADARLFVREFHRMRERAR